MSAPEQEAFVVAPERPSRYSMSFLRAAEGCLRRAHHERSVDTAGPDAVIGRFFHEAAAAVGFACSMRGQDRPDPAEALAIAERTMKRGEDHDPLPLDAYRQVLRMVAWWAPRARFQPGEQFEVDSRHELAGRTLSARIDRIVLDEHGVVHVKDYKTGWGDPAGKLTLQGEVYGWHAYELFPTAEHVVYEEHHVRFGLAPQPFDVPRDLVFGEAGTVEFLRTAVARLDAAYEAGELEATAGDACSRWGGCPVAASCPIPEWARPQTTLTDRAEAEDQLRALIVEEARIVQRKKAIRGYLERTGERAVVVDGQELGFSASAGSQTDWKQAALEAGVDTGKYVKPTKPSFGRRKEVSEG